MYGIREFTTFAEYWAGGACHRFWGPAGWGPLCDAYEFKFSGHAAWQAQRDGLTSYAVYGPM